MAEAPSYPPPLDRLFTFGDPRFGPGKGMPDYVAELGLTEQHIPALIEIARLWEEEKDEAFEWPAGAASIHAWRALGQLRAIEAVEPLLSMQNRFDEMDDDWYLKEFPEVFANIGPPAIPALTAYLADTLNREYPRVVAANGLAHIAQRHPESRDEVVKTLINQLSRHESEYSLNGLIVCDFLDLEATEAAEAIERAFAAGVIDETICGDWGDVREELGVPGLGIAPDNPPRPHFDRFPSFSDSPLRFGVDRDHQRKAEKQAKAKRKLQKKARKRNRKRR